MSVDALPNSDGEAFGLPYQVIEGVSIDGIPLKVPTLASIKSRLESIFNPGADPAMKSMMANVASAKSGCMIDVGANIGQSLVKWATLDPFRPYIGFEPNPASAFMCSLLIRMNQLRNHKLYAVGISEILGGIELRLNGLTDPSASFVEAFRPKGFFAESNSVDALVLRGDDVIEALNVQDLAFLKIDAEGAELEVLKSFQRTIEGLRPFITFEVLPHYLLVTRQVLPEEQVRFRQQRYAQIETILNSLNYKLLYCSGVGAPAIVDSIQPGPPGSEKTLKNYLAVPSEFESKLMSGWI